MCVLHPSRLFLLVQITSFFTGINTLRRLIFAPPAPDLSFVSIGARFLLAILLIAGSSTMFLNERFLYGCLSLSWLALSFQVQIASWTWWPEPTLSWIPPVGLFLRRDAVVVFELNAILGPLVLGLWSLAIAMRDLPGVVVWDWIRRPSSARQVSHDVSTGRKQRERR